MADGKFPDWLMDYITETEAVEISDAVREAEKHTSAEIVPMVVGSSATFGHVFLSLFLFLNFIFYYLANMYIQSEYTLFASLLLAFVFATILSRVNFVKRILTPKGDLELQVENRAQLEFHNLEMHQTRHATGVLIFVSLLEHRAVVLADKAISDALPPETWQNMLNILLVQIKKKNMKQGFVTAIDMAGKILKQKFPIQEGDTNELKNQLVVKE